MEQWSNGAISAIVLGFQLVDLGHQHIVRHLLYFAYMSGSDFLI